MAILIATLALAFCSLLVPIRAQQNATVSIPAENAYLLPRPFECNITQAFVDTETSNSTSNDLLSSAGNAPFISYDSEFDTLLGDSPQLQLVASGPDAFAYESGVWVYDHDQVWFTSSINAGSTYLSIMDLNTSTVFVPDLQSSNPGALPLANPNGGYYFNGLVYITTLGNSSVSPGIVSIDSITLEVDEVINSFFGLPLNPVDDITWASSNTTASAISCTVPNETYMFFTSIDFQEFGLNSTWPGPPSKVSLPNAVWRFTPETQTLQAVISRADVAIPNGVAVDATFSYLYVTDSAATILVGGGGDSWGSPAIYRFDLDAHCTPYNKRLFGLAREGGADGIKVDDFGRVWTSEFEGIVVRSSRGKVIGLFNQEAILGTKTPKINMANFALAGDKLVILAVDRIFMVQLAQTVVSAGRYRSQYGGELA